jgi:hypothetical protein
VNCYPFIEAEKAGRRNVARACALLKVSRAAFYAHLSGPSRRERADAELTEQIRDVHEDSKGRYGAPRSRPSTPPGFTVSAPGEDPTRATASRAEWTPSFPIRLCMWLRTVLGDRCRRSAISLRPAPSAMCASTSRSRVVRAANGSSAPFPFCWSNNSRNTRPSSEGGTQVSPRVTPETTRIKCLIDSSLRTHPAAPARRAARIRSASAEPLSMTKYGG